MVPSGVRDFRSSQAMLVPTMVDRIGYPTLEVGMAGCHGDCEGFSLLMNDDTPIPNDTVLRDDPPPRPPVEPDPGDCCGNGLRSMHL